jgi:hypothetical protein
MLINFDDVAGIKRTLAEKGHDLFRAKKDAAQLQVNRYYYDDSVELLSSVKRDAGTVVEKLEIGCVEDLESLGLTDSKTETETEGESEFESGMVMKPQIRTEVGGGKRPGSEIFFVRQDRSWTTLNVSRELFERFMTQYDVFLPFWKCVFTFGRKCEENEFEFPAFRARRTAPALKGEGNCMKINGMQAIFLGQD